MIARFAALAFVAASTPVPPVGSENDVVIAKLCNGGTIEIPIGNREKEQPSAPCHFKACHAGTCRTKVKNTV